MSTTDYPTEEERAAAWRAQQLERARFQAGLWWSLMAPPEPRQAVIDAWSPVLLWMLERRLGPTDPEEDL